MKKIYSLFLIMFVFIFTSAGCDSLPQGSETDTSNVAPTVSADGKSDDDISVNDKSDSGISEDDSTGETKSKILVAYYSAQQHTKGAAELIADELSADVFVITPKKPYTEEDLDWTNNDSRVVHEHDDEQLQVVELETTKVDNWEEYDTVFIGYPIWWQNASWVVNEFIKNNDFTGKTVIPFCTSQASGLGESGNNLAAMAGTGSWQEGMRFPESYDEAEVMEWVKSLNLK